MLNFFKIYSENKKLKQENKTLKEKINELNYQKVNENLLLMFYSPELSKNNTDETTEKIISIIIEPIISKFYSLDYKIKKELYNFMRLIVICYFDNNRDVRDIIVKMFTCGRTPYEEIAQFETDFIKECKYKLSKIKS